jgi:hypothetical protein
MADDQSDREQGEGDETPVGPGASLGLLVGIGVAFGAAIGAALDAVAMGVSMGIVFGAALAYTVGPALVAMFKK